jgi:hypothetical protein
MTLRDPRITSTLALVALTVWIGGLLALGAVAAPLVFAAVPFALAADAMAAVFARFDKIAMAAAAIVLATEAFRARVAGRVRVGDAVRILVSVVLAGLAVAEGVWVTPTIANLHAAGAIRGVGEAGASLATAHALAEQLGKAQVLLAVVLIALHVWTLDPARLRSRDPDEPLPD